MSHHHWHGGNDSNEDPFDINLSGTASLVPVPEIAVEQPVGTDVADGGSKDFGAVFVGASKSLVFTVKNTGSADLTLTLPITFSGVDASQFTVPAPPSTSVIPGGSTTFIVRFAPLTAGAKVAALQLVNNDSNEGVYDINLSGSGALVPAPEIAIEQPVGVNLSDGGSSDFGAVFVGASKNLVFTVKNTGNADLNLTLPITFSGADAASFTVTVPPTTPVLPGGATTFTVRFSPLTVGAKVAALQLANNDSNEDPFDINLSGTASLVPVPEIAVEQPVGTDVADGGSKDFGAVFVGASKNLVFTVKNTGSANLTLTLPITFSGVDASQFTVPAPPSTSVIPGGSTTFIVRFAPLTAGAKVAALQLVNNDSNEGVYDINLSGSGALVPAPEIAIEQPVGVNLVDGGSRDFGPVLVGGSKSLIFTIINSGNANLNLTLPITFSGVDASQFTVSAPPSSSVIPGGSTTFIVRFAPLTAGPKFAALHIGNNDSNENPFDISFNGAGSGVFVVSASPITLNPQTGLFEQAVRLTNSDLITVAAVRLFVHTLPTDVKVYNASGSIGGIPFLRHDFPLASGGEVIILIEYYRVSRIPIPQPAFVVEATTAVPSTATGPILAIQRDVQLSTGRFLVDFLAVPGSRYAVQYSSNMTDWRTANPIITAPANRVQWYDDGPPKTESKPTSIGSRFYRVIQLP